MTLSLLCCTLLVLNHDSRCQIETLVGHKEFWPSHQSVLSRITEHSKAGRLSFAIGCLHAPLFAMKCSNNAADVRRARRTAERRCGRSIGLGQCGHCVRARMGHWHRPGKIAPCLHLLPACFDMALTHRMPHRTGTAKLPKFCGAPLHLIWVLCKLYLVSCSLNPAGGNARPGAGSACIHQEVAWRQGVQGCLICHPHHLW